MRKIDTLEEIQEILFGLVSQFDEFCVKHNLQYALSGGSCLGAIRHGGFIPWDDDIDVVMPRPDYERLIAITESTQVSPHLKLLTHKRDAYYEYPFSKLVDTRTLLKENHFKEYPMGIFMDIFPLDGVPNDEKGQEKLYRKIRYCSFMLCATFGQYENRGTGFWDYTFGCIGTFFMHRIYHKARRHYIMKMDRLSSKIKYEDADKVGCVIWGVGWKRENNEKKVFFPTANKAKFRERDMFIPADYDTYLRKMYGNYMQLPPENQRVRHDFEAYVISD